MRSFSHSGTMCPDPQVILSNVWDQEHGRAAAKENRPERSAVVEKKEVVSKDKKAVPKGASEGAAKKKKLEGALTVRKKVSRETKKISKRKSEVSPGIDLKPI